MISLARNLLAYESIKTTLNRAKAAQPVVEKLITWGKDGSIEKKRLAYTVLGEHSLVSRLFGEIAPRFNAKNSGFTRILRMEKRRGDDAQLALFQLTILKEKPKTEKSGKKARSADSEKNVIDVEAHEDAAKVQKPKKESKAAAKDDKVADQAPHKDDKTHADKSGKKFLGEIRGIFKKERDSL